MITYHAKWLLGWVAFGALWSLPTPLYFWAVNLPSSLVAIAGMVCCQVIGMAVYRNLWPENKVMDA